MVVPRVTYDRDPTVDYQIHKAALYTMATCHSLRKVDDSLLGDPLDVKMFEFTNWVFEESSQLPSTAGDGQIGEAPSSIVRPPTGTEFVIDNIQGSTTVSIIEGSELSSSAKQLNRVFRLNWEF